MIKSKLVLKPKIIFPRKTVDSILLNKLTSNYLLLKYQSKVYSYCDLIQYWLEKIFFPHVKVKQYEEFQRSGYSGYAYLIFDDFSGHSKALEKYDLESLKIKIIYLVPHASHILQPLDIVIFHCKKSIQQR